MFAIGIRYLNGFVAATLPDSHDRAEWPPHPGRVFMALAAAHFQTGADPEERAALEWLEMLGEAPSIRAGQHFERPIVTQYVPVNDRPGPAKALLQTVPLTRERQPRTFARAALEDEVVYLSWHRVEAPESVRRAMVNLCSKVTRIGHSSSLVYVWVANGSDDVGEPNWIPDEDHADLHLRVAGPGTLAELERRYNGALVETYAELKTAEFDDADQESTATARRRLRDDFADRPPPRLRPHISIYQGYARRDPTLRVQAAAGTAFSPHILVLTLQREDAIQREMDLPCVLPVVERWRDAILSRSNDLPDNIRSLLSGHHPSGAPLDAPHLAFLPMAFVGHPHADGRLLGMGLVWPTGLSREDRLMAQRAIGRVRDLRLGRLGRWKIDVERRSNPPFNLRPHTWTASPDGATHWATVTPIVFDRHPKSKDRTACLDEVAEMIAAACMRIGLPKPRDIVVTPVTAHLGVPPAFEFPRLRRKDDSERRHTHAILIFDRPVCGPVLIGAGRYRGYGVARPLAQENTSYDG